MLDSDTDNDKGTPNAIKLAGNSCGCIMEIDVDSSMNAVSAKMLVCGTPQSVTGDPNACIVDGIANPDNVAMIPDYKQLLIGEDTSKHDNNLVWVYDLHSGDLTRVASVPTGAETTSPYWFTVGDWSYISMVAQTPMTWMLTSGTSGLSQGREACIGPLLEQPGSKLPILSGMIRRL